MQNSNKPIKIFLLLTVLFIKRESLHAYKYLGYESKINKVFEYLRSMAMDKSLIQKTIEELTVNSTISEQCMHSLNETFLLSNDTENKIRCE